MRPFFIAWLALALLLLGIGRLSRGGDGMRNGQRVRVVLEGDARNQR